MPDSGTRTDKALGLDEPLLYRQVHPVGHVDEGRVTRLVFRPPPDHDGCVSVDRSSKATLQQSFELFELAFKVESYGTLGVEVHECHSAAQKHGVPVEVREDPIRERNFVNDAHAVVDLSKGKRKALERIAKELRALAASRGWLYPDSKIGTPVVT